MYFCQKNDYMIKENIDLKTDGLVLSYIEDIALDHCLDIDFDEDGFAYSTPSFRAIYQFADRYNKKKLNKLEGINRQFEYDDYKNNEDIQNTLSGLKIDSDKFWYLLLYIYDYSLDISVDGISLTDTPREQLNNFVTAINENFKDDKSIKISLDIKKHNVIIDNPTAISYLVSLLEEDLKKSVYITDMNSSKFIFKSNESNYFIIWYFTKTFISFFKVHPDLKAKSKSKDIKSVSYNKKLLISRLICLTKLSLNENFEDDDLKGILNKYKDYKSKNIHNIYQ